METGVALGMPVHFFAAALTHEPVGSGPTVIGSTTGVLGSHDGRRAKTRPWIEMVAMLAARRVQEGTAFCGSHVRNVDAVVECAECVAARAAQRPDQPDHHLSQNHLLA